jgi:hypothetical protein
MRQEIAECGLKSSDRIVWLSDNGPEFGEVKWVGVLPDSRRNDITVGVEFVSTARILCSGTKTPQFGSHVKNLFLRNTPSHVPLPVCSY